MSYGFASAICKGDCLQSGRWSSSHVGANCIRAQGCSVLALAHVYVVCTCRSGASAQPHHHASKATALSLALHMAERAASGKAGMHSQGCSAPSIAQMQGSKGRTPPMHILLLSGESSRKVKSQASSLSPLRCVRNALFLPSAELRHCCCSLCMFEQMLHSGVGSKGM